MTKVKIFNKGFNYSQDGPGNRLIYHLQGCNMKCTWCANPEGMPVKGELVVENKWLIESICPYGAISKETINRELCIDCEDRACVTKHRSKGINLSYNEYDTEFILGEIKSSIPMFYDGGGVTFSGGEPTMQFEALEELLRGSKKFGVNTAIETNGTHPHIDKLFPYIDHLIMDFKLAHEEKHLLYTGVSNKHIKDNFKKVFDLGKAVLVRIPVINNINANKEEIAGIIDFISLCNTGNTEFELLPYHEYGKVKWEKCGRRYVVTDGYVTRDKIKEFEKMFIDRGFVIKRT